MSDLTKRLYKIADEIKRLQKRVSDADECIEEQEEMLEHLIMDQGQYEEEIERLQKAYRPADMIEYQELVAENERLQKRNALLEDVVAAADVWSYVEPIAARQAESDLHDALDKLREVGDE